MRRPNHTIQNVHGSEPGKFEHLWMVPGSAEGLPVGCFPVLDCYGYAGRGGLDDFVDIFGWGRKEEGILHDLEFVALSR
jgi:hypothetical protein